MKKKIYETSFGVLIFATICTILWGSAYPCIKRGYEIFELAADDVSGKLVFAGIRFGLAGIVTLLFFVLSGQKLVLPKGKQWTSLGAISFIQTFIQYICFYVGLSNTTGVKGSILNSSVTFFSCILAHFFMKGDRLNVRKIIGTILGFGGIIVINLDGIGSESFSLNFLGDGMVVMAAFAFSLGALIAKKLSGELSPVLITGYQLTIGGIALVVAGVVTGGKLNHVDATGIVLLVYMILLSAVAYTLWTVLNKYNNMSAVAIYNFLTPVFGSILSAIFLRENLMNPVILVALILVCIGICVVNMPSKRRIKVVDKTKY